MARELTSSEFACALRRGRIAVARCENCGRLHAFPTPSCFECGHSDLSLSEHEGNGEIFSWVVNHYDFRTTAEAANPGTVLLVDLEGGSRVYGRLKEMSSSSQGVSAGCPVRLDPAATADAGHPVFVISPVASASPDRKSDVMGRIPRGLPAKACHQVVAEVAGRNPDKVAFELGGFQRLTYRTLVERVAACAGLFQRRGIKSGDRVAVMANNRTEVLEAWLACSTIGAVFVPFNPALRGHILADMISLTEPALALVEPEWAARLKEAEPSVELIVIESLAPGIMTDWGEASPGPTGQEPDPESLSIIMFTSGTTGRSKGVMWSHMTINCMAWSSGVAMRLDETDRLHTALPMFHGNALILSVYNALTLGATAVVSRKFSASGFAKELAQMEATATSFLGSMANMVLSRDHGAAFRGQLRKALVIPASPQVIAELEARYNCKVVTAYGLADAGLPLFSGLDFPVGVCGRAFADLWEARIVGPGGAAMGAGEVGELAVKPRFPFVSALGYWRMPDETRKVRDDGWIRTGDLMRQDAGGWFTFVDRGKDMIRRRGENVSSQEVESVFLAHPDVADCAVYPVPSEMSEDEIMLAVVPRAGRDTSALDLIRFAEPKLPYFAIPRFVRFMTALPKNSMEKVLKSELRKDALVAGTWDLLQSGHEIKR